MAGGGGLLCDDGGDGLPSARARRGHGPLLTLHDGDLAAPPGGAGREIELRPAAHQGHDRPAARIVVTAARKLNISEQTWIYSARPILHAVGRHEDPNTVRALGTL